MTTALTSQLIPLPLPLPRGFLDMLGYEPGQGLVAVYWEQAVNCLVLFDGVAFRPVTKDDPFIWLCMDLRMIDFEQQHGTTLWDFDRPTTHWLLIDVDADDAWIAPAGVSRRCVLEQSLQAKLPLKERIAK